jgi:methyl-accepting chemotaxis protein
MAVVRWTDEMLDSLASTVGELSTTVGELTSTVGKLSTTVGELSTTVSELSTTVSELSTTVHEVRDGLDGFRITAQALLQIAAQNQRDMELIKQRQAESDQRFNVLLEELRYLIRRDRED